MCVDDVTSVSSRARLPAHGGVLVDQTQHMPKSVFSSSDAMSIDA
jgi:hypothetical protein